MKYAVLAWALLLALCLGFAGSDAYDMRQTYNVMRLPGVQVTVKWEGCGEVNAYYYPRDKSITLCNELKELDPAVVRFIFAHEMAHAIIVQKGVPFTGLHETAADELAAVMLGLYGHQDDVRAAGRWFFARPNGDYWPGEHPSHLRRGFALMCLANKGERGWVIGDDGIAPCPKLEWHRAVDSWMRLLGYR